MLLLLLLPLLLLSHCCRCCEIIAGKQLECHGAQLVSLQQLPPPSPNITTIDLTSNRLGELAARAFNGFPNVQGLLLGNNHLRLIHDDAFDNLAQLRVLDLDGNYLLEVPRAVSKLRNLKELSLSNNRIQALAAESFGVARNLLSLDLRANPIKELHAFAFRRMTQLKKLILSNTKVLSDFPVLDDCKSLEMLRIDRAQLSHVPAELCRHSPKLKSLEFKTNRITAIPNLKDCRDLRVLDLANNRISSLDGRPFEASSALHDLLLAKNAIKTIPKDAFVGLSRLQVLDLESNAIEFVHPEAFGHIGQLQDLNLGNNIFPELPIAGLSGILHLKTFNNPALREFPGPERFPRAKTMLLSYAYHCCSYVADDVHGAAQTLDDELGTSIGQESVLFPSDDDFDMSLWNANLSDLWPQLNNMSDKFGAKINELWDNFGTDFTYPGNLPAYVEEYFEDEEGRASTPRPRGGKPIQCRPEPGPFLPCQDLFDWWTLRCGVWVVFLLAMLGNGTVVFVLLFSRSKMDVPRFLVCNLAAADFFMGLYLGMLAVVDAATLGEFRKHAIPWQMSAGCRAAGFLGVLSSELSVYSLAVITLERNYAITHAMHLNKRLSLRHAGYIMGFGWCFALGMAALPLLGVSDYRKFAICLPFETTSPPAMAYVVFLMLVNGLAFLILMGCYLKMYCAIRGSQAWNSNDSRIAKRMALLVFTDFLCWSPIAFFSLTATFGLQLVSLEQAKVFAVFVLPLNSCCNPFLYAILTKQFKKDCVLLCKAIEESRVSRGVGRCRHGSNFSNRMTPAHGHSLVGDRSAEHDRLHHQHHQHQINLYHQPGCPYNNNNNNNNHHHHHHHHHSSNNNGNNARLVLERARPATGLRWWQAKIGWPCSRSQRQRRNVSLDAYACRATEIQQKQHKRASSMSSSENYSSSRSDSWRQNQCGIPLRFLDPKRRGGSSWLITRKASQDSNLSSSRNDSSGSGTTASTSTWRMSRSSASTEVCASLRPTRSKPRLTRQHAIQEPDSPASPGRLTVRLLATIPSAAEMSEQCDEESVALADEHERREDRQQQCAEDDDHKDS